MCVWIFFTFIRFLRCENMFIKLKIKFFIKIYSICWFSLSNVDGLAAILNYGSFPVDFNGNFRFFGCDNMGNELKTNFLSSIIIIIIMYFTCRSFTYFWRSPLYSFILFIYCCAQMEFVRNCTFHLLYFTYWNLQIDRSLKIINNN